jgi:heme exporter protein A
MLLADVPLWLMDEPYTNLDREGRSLVAGVVNEHLAGGGLCVMAAHQDVDIDAPVQKVILQ